MLKSLTIYILYIFGTGISDCAGADNVKLVLKSKMKFIDDDDDDVDKRWCSLKAIAICWLALTAQYDTILYR